jgi:glycosyltransferase involved in cell wall biosynthesis
VHRPGATIGIDARAAAEVPAGRGRVVRELLRALAVRADDTHYVLYAREPWEGAPLDGRFSWRLIRAGEPRWHLRAALAANAECDAYLASNSYLTTWFLRVPAVPIVYDMVAFDRRQRPNKRSALIERLTLRPAVRRSRAFVAISDATAREFERLFPGVSGRVTVAHLGASLPPTLPAEEAQQLPVPGFVLAVGTLEPRKNLPRLVDAYRLLDEATQRRHPLVVVGALGWEAGPTLEALRSLGDRARLLGYVSDAALGELYRRSAVFCYPSLGEGFGLPVLEAMALGTPVVTSNVSSLPEVGGEAVEYVDPRQPAAIAAGLRAVLDDEARAAELARLGPGRAAGFSWEAFAAKVLDVLQAARTRS